MRYRILLALLLTFTLLFCYGIIANEEDGNFVFTKHPNKIELNGGCSTVELITFKWQSDDSIYCVLNSVVTPDSEGITVRYEPASLTMQPNTDYNVWMFVELSMNLKPGSYDIKTQASGSMLSGDSTEQYTTTGHTEINTTDTNETINETSNEQNNDEQLPVDNITDDNVTKMGMSGDFHIPDFVYYIGIGITLILITVTLIMKKIKGGQKK